MRAAARLATLIAILPTIAAAQIVSKDQAGPSEKEVFDMLGSSMSQVFAKYGFPSDLDVSDKKSKKPQVRFDYGDFGFAIVDKQVTQCQEWHQLAGDSVFGVKLGEAVEDIENRLGKPKMKITNPGGGGIILWDDAKQDREIEVVFGKANKCIGLLVNKK